MDKKVNDVSCQECGICSNVCPIVEIEPDRILSDLFFEKSINPWLCCSCHLCTENCPVELSSRDQMFAIRRLKKTEGFKGGEMLNKYMLLLKERGFLFPVDADTNQERARLGLPEIDLKKISLGMRSFFRNMDLARKNDNKPI